MGDTTRKMGTTTLKLGTTTQGNLTKGARSFSQLRRIPTFTLGWRSRVALLFTPPRMLIANLSNVLSE
jgi:hypothetical protein